MIASNSMKEWENKMGIKVGWEVLTFLYHPNDVTGGRASARHFKVTFCPSALVIFRLGSSFARWTETVGGSEYIQWVVVAVKYIKKGRKENMEIKNTREIYYDNDNGWIRGKNLIIDLHATLILLLSSSDPFENQGFDDLHVNSAPSFSADTLNVKILDVKFESAASLFTVTSACLNGSPSSSHVTLAAGKEPHVSQRIGVGRPAVSNSFGVTIFTLIGFTISNSSEEYWRIELKKSKRTDEKKIVIK